MASATVLLCLTYEMKNAEFTQSKRTPVGSLFLPRTSGKPISRALPRLERSRSNERLSSSHVLKEAVGTDMRRDKEGTLLVEYVCRAC